MLIPYIPQKDRGDIDFALNLLLQRSNYSVGELNYMITRLMHHQLKPVSYTKVNNLIGMLTCVQLELYRRVGSPYEDKKIKENDDVMEVEGL